MSFQAHDDGKKGMPAAQDKFVSNKAAPIPNFIDSRQ
jgi:hypothetical protein